MSAHRDPFHTLLQHILADTNITNHRLLPDKNRHANMGSESIYPLQEETSFNVSSLKYCFRLHLFSEKINIILMFHNSSIDFDCMHLCAFLYNEKLHFCVCVCCVFIFCKEIINRCFRLHFTFMHFSTVKKIIIFRHFSSYWDCIYLL